MDHGGWYDLESKEFNNFKGIQFVACMGPPGGGRSAITQRYLRHYHKIYIETFGSESMTTIYSTILDWFFSKQSEPFTRQITTMKNNLIAATLYIFHKASTELLPTPAKIHYIYNLRDVSKVFQGLSRASSIAIKDQIQMIKLWVHECQRVFQDRLINSQDRDFFDLVIKESVKKFFNHEADHILSNKSLLFADFFPIVIEGKKHTDVYCEIEDHEEMHNKMKEILNYYNQISQSKMDLVLFSQAIEHVIFIVRILQQPLGNALLLGVGGSGRKSLALLAASITEYEVFQVEISKNFTMVE